MQNYYKIIAKKTNSNIDNFINNTSQPTMFGGKRVRNHPLPASTDYDFPGTLAVGGTDSGDLVGGFNWNSLGHGIIDTGKNIATPVLTELGKDALHAYLGKGGARMHGGKYGMQSISKGFKSLTKSFGKYKNIALFVLGCASAGIAMTYHFRGHEIDNDQALEIVKHHPKEIGDLEPNADPQQVNEIIHAVNNEEIDINGGIRHLQGGKWGLKTIGNALGSVGSEVTKALIPVATTLAVDAAKGYMGASRGSKVKEHFQEMHPDIINHLIESGSIHPSQVHLQGGKWGLKTIGNALGSVGSEVTKALIPVATTLAVDAAKGYMGAARPRGRPRKHLQGGKYGIETMTKFAKAAAPFAPLLLAAGRKGGAELLGKSPVGKTGYPRALTSYGGARNDSRKARGFLVGQLMKTHGMTLSEASKYIKDHNIEY